MLVSSLNHLSKRTKAVLKVQHRTVVVLKAFLLGHKRGLCILPTNRSLTLHHVLARDKRYESTDV